MVTMAARVAVAGVLSLLLAGCSGEPGTAEIKQAFGNNARFMQSIAAGMQLEASVTGGAAMSADELLATLVVEKGQCAPATGSSGFVCDFRAGRDMGGERQFGPWTKARFFQASDGWQFEEPAP